MGRVKLLLPKSLNQKSRKKLKGLYKNTIKSPFLVNNIENTYFVAIPGFIDYHLHLGSSATFKFPRNLRKYIELEENLWKTPKSQKNREKFERLTALLSISSGVTEIYTIRGFNLRKKFPLKVGIPIVAGSYLSTFFGKIDKLINDSRNSTYIFIHSLYRTGMVQIKEALKMAEKYDLNVFMHFMENPWEREYIERKFNTGPLKVLKKFDFPPKKTYLIHCTFLTADEIDELIDEGYRLVLCPYSNLNFSKKLPEIDPELFYDGVRDGKILFGSDGIGNGRSTLVENVKLAMLYYGFPYDKISKIRGLISPHGLQIYGISKLIKIQKFDEAVQWILSSSQRPILTAYSVENSIYLVSGGSNPIKTSTYF